MKKIVTIFLLLAMPLFIIAQVEKPITKGNFLIGGDASGSYSKNTYPDRVSFEQYDFSLSPSLGYFIGNGLAIGISPLFDYTKVVVMSWEHLSVGAGVYLKYYLKSGLFIKGNTNYRYSLSYYDDNSDRRGSDSIDISAGVGYAFFLNSKISIEPSLNYRLKLYSEGSSQQNQFYFSVGFQKFL